MNISMDNLAPALLAWFDKHGRKNLPWKNPRDAYRVWISEIMLQQTQVQTVIPYFQRFIERFPNNEALANASEDELLSYWSGLGYYSRAHNIHQTAKILKEKYKNQFPEAIEEIAHLPGIGPSTAAAICSQAFHQPTAILDANVKRVLARYCLIDGDPSSQATQKQLWQKAKEAMPKTRCADYTQAIMDFGALCCRQRNPDCSNCPLKKNCKAYEKQCVADFPAKKAKKIIPIKREQFLIFYDKENNIYLEKRPASGIWRSLWSCPSLSKEQNIRDFMQEKYGCTEFKLIPLLAMKHRFTHFLLDIEAYVVDLSLHKSELKNLIGQWVSQKELKNFGIPTPIHKITTAFYSLDLLPNPQILLECKG